MKSMLEEWASVMRELSTKQDEYQREAQALSDRLQLLREKRQALDALVYDATNGLHCSALQREHPDGATPNSIRVGAMAIDG